MVEFNESQEVNESQKEVNQIKYNEESQKEDEIVERTEPS